MNATSIQEHLRKDRYGDFQLTGAIRPSVDVPVYPRQGYRREIFRDPRQQFEAPLLAAAVSAERLFEVFLEVIEPMGEVVDVVLESSHDRSDGGHRDIVREQIDRLVFTSTVYDFEDLLLNDGCTGLAVMSTEHAMEIQFDEHKLLLIYAKNLRPFEQILERCGVRRDSSLRLLSEGEHLHSSASHHQDAFEQLCVRLGVEEYALA